MFISNAFVKACVDLTDILVECPVKKKKKNYFEHCAGMSRILKMLLKCYIRLNEKYKAWKKKDYES